VAATRGKIVGKKLNLISIIGMVLGVLMCFSDKYSIIVSGGLIFAASNFLLYIAREFNDGE
tara:strand:- start:92 stop:274 length:183 start_codon:yes stop_codon:yes gene_type:complete